MRTLTDYCVEQFGEKVYKLSLNGGMSCPNRDGRLDTWGCIFCSAGGSGDFAAPAALSIPEQLEAAKDLVRQKYRGGKFIAYFQAYTNTYGPVERLRALYSAAIAPAEVVALSIATRPDCLPPEVLELLKEMRAQKPLWVELGLQTIHPRTAAYIRRGFDLACFQRGVDALKSLGAHVVVHVILGLPGETEQEMLETVRYVAGCGAGGIKLQLLHVLEGTDLAEDYRQGRFQTMELEAYVALVKKCVALLPEEMVVHRLTGDGPKRLLLAPAWSGDKKRVLNALREALA